MRGFVALALAGLLAVAGPSSAQMTLTGAGSSKGAVASGSCLPGTQAAAFIARAGTLTANETKFICLWLNTMFSTNVTTPGLTGTLGDNTCAAYAYALGNTTAANLNVISTSFGLAQVGTLTFTADSGYTGDGASGTFTGAPNPTNCTGQTTDSSGFTVLVQNNRTSNNTGVMIGVAVSGGFSILELLSGGNVQWDINDAGTFPAQTNTTTKGGWGANRTGASATAVYHNGSATAFGTSTAASGNQPTNSYRIFALDNSGSMGNFSTDTVSCVMFHAGFNGTDEAAAQNSCNAALQAAYGNNVY